LTQLAAVR